MASTVTQKITDATTNRALLLPPETLHTTLKVDQKKKENKTEPETDPVQPGPARHGFCSTWSECTVRLFVVSCDGWAFNVNLWLNWRKKSPPFLSVTFFSRHRPESIFVFLQTSYFIRVCWHEVVCSRWFLWTGASSSGRFPFGSRSVPVWFSLGSRSVPGRSDSTPFVFFAVFVFLLHVVLEGCCCFFSSLLYSQRAQKKPDWLKPSRTEGTSAERSWFWADSPPSNYFITAAE